MKELRWRDVARALALLLVVPAVSQASEAAHSWEPHVLDVVPFGVLLLCIALLGLFHLTAHWWEHNRNKAIVCALLSAPVLWRIVSNDPHLLSHAGLEYVQFLTLIASLFIVAGGIHIAGDLRATPAMNTLILGAGYMMASIVGTTGAAMVLIYPLLRANSERKYVAHTVVFFIFTVANAGGLLTPLGDPPLFLGYLRGISFTWFAQELWPLWLATGLYLLAAYWLLDASWFYPHETAADIREDIEHVEPLRMDGLFNLPLMAVIVAAVGIGTLTPWRELILVACAGLSLVYSSRTQIGRSARALNRFSFGPIVEVAVVFAGIFITMIPALSLLSQKGSELGVTTSTQYFWATGLFSSFLDNAPTFLVFLTLAMSTLGLDANNPVQVQEFMTASAGLLAAISVGAVFMGANTYIGNAPNFMVKSVAEAQGVKMPSFFGYMGWSCVFLIPWFVGVGVFIQYFM